MTWCQILLFLTISFLITHFGINEIVKLAKLNENAKINNNVIFKLKANSLLTYWLWIFLCASLMNSWFWWKYIFGMIIIAKSILGMTSTIVNELKQFKWMAIFELVLSVGLGCYLLYTIPNTELRDVVVQITSSIIGGVLTLVGVSWTIIAGRKEQRDIQRNQIKPIIYALNSKNDISDAMSAEHNYIDIVLDATANKSSLGAIQNTDNGIYIINKTIVDNVEYPLSHPIVLKKNMVAIINLLSQDIELKIVTLVGVDVQNNEVRHDLILSKDEHNRYCIDHVVEQPMA